MSYKKLILKSTATIENAISHYSHINKSLAQKLEKEIRNSFTLISKNPESFQFRYHTIRIVWLKTFPYGIYYIFDSDEVYILAFWHTKEDAVNRLKK